MGLLPTASSQDTQIWGSMKLLNGVGEVEQEGPGKEGKGSCRPATNYCALNTSPARISVLPFQLKRWKRLEESWAHP